MIITAQPGRVFKRIHDGFIMGGKIILGKDFSTGTEREDLPEYYVEVFDPFILPTIEWLKADIQLWLTENGISYLTSDNKEQLLARISIN
jgi:hypothetical protein